MLWYRDTMKLIEGERLHMSSVGDTYKLSITELTTQDYGVYYCRFVVSCYAMQLNVLCYAIVSYAMLHQDILSCAMFH